MEGTERPRLPDTLSRLRMLLDEAAVKRTFLPLEEPARSGGEIAAALGIPEGNAADTLAAEADGDRLIILVPANCRVDLRKAADLLGARQVSLTGRGPQRAARPMPDPAMVTGLPTVIDRSLLSHEFVFGPSGDPLWVLRITPEALRKVTHPHVGDIVKRARPLHRAPEPDDGPPAHGS